MTCGLAEREYFWIHYESYIIALFRVLSKTNYRENAGGIETWDMYF